MDEKQKKPTENKHNSVADDVNSSIEGHKAVKELNQSMVKMPKIDMSTFTFPNYKIPGPCEIPNQEELNNYQSASILMEALANEAMQWKNNLPENYNPAILVILNGGVQVNVHTLAQVSFHGIRVEGTMNGSPCSLLAHQSTVQLLCYAEEYNPEEPRNPIGFLWGGKRVDV